MNRHVQCEIFQREEIKREQMSEINITQVCGSLYNFFLFLSPLHSLFKHITDFSLNNLYE